MFNKFGVMNLITIFNKFNNLEKIENFYLKLFMLKLTKFYSAKIITLEFI